MSGNVLGKIVRISNGLSLRIDAVAVFFGIVGDCLIGICKLVALRFDGFDDSERFDNLVDGPDGFNDDPGTTFDVFITVVLDGLP